MAIRYCKTQSSVYLRVYPSMRVYLSGRTPHDHRPRPRRAHGDCAMGVACERMAALLLRQSGRNIAVAPAGLASTAPSRRAAMFIAGKKWVTITIPPFDSVIPVFALVDVVATALC
jgi:hypothetical protein